MNVWFILLCMFFLHVFDDFTLQGWMANGKQKSWWKENAPASMYKHDYVVCLILHSFSWSFLMTLPALFFRGFNVDVYYAMVLMFTIAIHAITDDLKANRKLLNLVEDQTVHVVQVLVAWLILVVLR